jgi:hypothetical protein
MDHADEPGGATGYAIAAIAAITILIAVIAARTFIAAARGQLLFEPAIGAPSPRTPVAHPRLRRGLAAQPGTG